MRPLHFAFSIISNGVIGVSFGLLGSLWSIGVTHTPIRWKIIITNTGISTTASFNFPVLYLLPRFLPPPPMMMICILFPDLSYAGIMAFLLLPWIGVARNMMELWNSQLYWFHDHKPLPYKWILCSISGSISIKYICVYCLNLKFLWMFFYNAFWLFPGWKQTGRYLLQGPYFRLIYPDNCPALEDARTPPKFGMTGCFLQHSLCLLLLDHYPTTQALSHLRPLPAGFGCLRWKTNQWPSLWKVQAWPGRAFLHSPHSLRFTNPIPWFELTIWISPPNL